MYIALIIISLCILILLIQFYIKVKNKKEYKQKLKSKTRDKIKYILDLSQKSKFNTDIDDIDIKENYEENLDYIDFKIKKNKITSIIRKEKSIFLKEKDKLEYVNEVYNIMLNKKKEKKYNWKLIDKIIIDFLPKILNKDEIEYIHPYIEKIKKYKEINVIANNYYKLRMEQIKKLKDKFELEYEIDKSIDKNIDLFNNDIACFRDINIVIDQEDINYDYIIITKEGVFVLEVKKDIATVDTYTIEITAQGDWIKKYINGNIQKINSKLVNNDNQRIKVLENIINDKLDNSYKEYLNIKNIIVVSNNEVITNESDHVVVKASEVYKYIKGFNTELSTDAINNIGSIILSKASGSKQVVLPDLKKEIEENIELFDIIDKDIFENIENNILKVINYAMEIKEAIEHKDNLNNINKNVHQNENSDLSIDFGYDYCEERASHVKEWYAAEMIFENIFESIIDDDYDDDE